MTETAQGHHWKNGECQYCFQTKEKSKGNFCPTLEEIIEKKKLRDGFYDDDFGIARSCETCGHIDCKLDRFKPNPCADKVFYYWMPPKTKRTRETKTWRSERKAITKEQKRVKAVYAYTCKTCVKAQFTVRAKAMVDRYGFTCAFCHNHVYRWATVEVESKEHHSSLSYSRQWRKENATIINKLEDIKFTSAADIKLAIERIKANG